MSVDAWGKETDDSASRCSVCLWEADFQFQKSSTSSDPASALEAPFGGTRAVPGGRRERYLAVTLATTRDRYLQQGRGEDRPALSLTRGWPVRAGFVNSHSKVLSANAMKQSNL